MADLDMTLKTLKSNAPPTLKDRIRAHMPAIEEARASGVRWKVIQHTLASADVVIDLQLLATYVCQIRKETRPPEATADADDLPVKPTPFLEVPGTSGSRQVPRGDSELPRHVAGGLLAPPPLQ